MPLFSIEASADLENVKSLSATEDTRWNVTLKVGSTTKNYVATFVFSSMSFEFSDTCSTYRIR